MFILCILFILLTQTCVYPVFSVSIPLKPCVDDCLVFILPTLLLSAELPVLIVNHLVTAESRQNSFEVEKQKTWIGHQVLRQL